MQLVSLKRQTDLDQRNECLRQQLHTLAKYLVNDPDLDYDVCQPQAKAEICPYRTPPYGDKDERVCISCVIRVLCGSPAAGGTPHD